MLCTPPAFILSQDQTLYELLLNAPCEALILFCSAYFKFKRNQRVPYISCDTYVYNILLCTLCCSVFNVRSRSPLSGTALLSYHNFSHLSIGFLNFFQVFLRYSRSPFGFPQGLHILTPFCLFVNPIFAKKSICYTFSLFSQKGLAFLFIFLYTDPVNRVDAHAYSAEGTGSCPWDEEISFRDVGVASR